MKQKYLLLAWLCLSVGITHAQDPHFSQYFTTPIITNPALAGKNVADWRAGINMRSQWWGDAVKPYYTVTAAVEKALGSNANHWGLGAMVVSDQSNGGLLKNNYFSFTAAYHVSLDKNAQHVLSAGLTGTYADRILDPSKFQFQSQLGSMGFQRDIPSGDGINVQKNNYFDVSGGLHYTYTGDKYGISAGGALFHAAQPREGVYNSNTYNMSRKTSLQAGGWMATGYHNVLQLTSLAEFQGGNSIYTLGGIYKLGLDDDLLQSVNLGLFKRFGDAVYPYVALETKRWIAGLTYDFVSTDIKNYTSVQSMELSFVYQLGKTRSTPLRADNILIY